MRCRLYWLLWLPLLTACSSTPRLESAASGSVDLTGHWVLDRQASDDVRERLLPLLQKHERRMRRTENDIEAREGSLDPAPDSPPDAGDTTRTPQKAALPPGDYSTLHWMQHQREREELALVRWLAAAGELDITQRAGEIRIANDKGEGSRTLVPGESSALFVAMGGFEVTSGWKGTTFVVSSRGTGDNDIRMLEEYALDQDGKRLTETVETRLPAVGKQSFRFVYRRASTT